MGLPSTSEWLNIDLHPSSISMALAARFKIGTGDEGLSQGGRFSNTDKAGKNETHYAKSAISYFPSVCSS